MKPPSDLHSRLVACINVPTAAIPGHILKIEEYPHRPVAALWEGGGTHGKQTQIDNANRLVECWNALVGIPDPNAALKAAREALEWALSNLHDDAEAVFPKQVEFCHTSLAALKGEQP